jgi:hypothetical protein
LGYFVLSIQAQTLTYCLIKKEQVVLPIQKTTNASTRSGLIQQDGCDKKIKKLNYNNTSGMDDSVSLYLPLISL